MKKEKSGVPVIVIGRQFGSGGRRIGKIIAQKLGIRYYDSELLSEVASRLGFSPGLFEIHDEKRPSAFRAMIQGAFGLADNFHDVSFSSERTYAEQSKVIREICKNEGCVIVGRTADYILRDHDWLTSVFLHAPLSKRASVVLKRGEARSLKEAEELAKKFDRDRENYYNFYTGGSNWGKAENYSVCLDSSKASEEELAQLIITFHNLHKPG